MKRSKIEFYGDRNISVTQQPTEKQGLPIKYWSHDRLANVTEEKDDRASREVRCGKHDDPSVVAYTIDRNNHEKFKAIKIIQVAGWTPIPLH